MGLFKKNRTPWRNKNGSIICPGDDCPKNCDDTCPIYLNTKAVVLMQNGHEQDAISLYEKALQIEPDFYDAWNNLGGIYGGMSQYQKAYGCYKKAHEIDKERPNPVYGLILTSRDLGNYEECLFWCSIYKTLSKDHREQAIQEEVNARLGKSTGREIKNKSGAAESNTVDKISVVKVSQDKKWMLLNYDKQYYMFMDKTGTKAQTVYTPGGNILKTTYLDLAERILADLQQYGPKDMRPESILPWHYTMCDNFAKMEHKEAENVLNSCFLCKYDWTYEKAQSIEQWKKLFGNKTQRITDMRTWLARCSHMQIVAICCIGNAYHSINIAYVLASLMENYKNSELREQFKKLADMIADYSEYGPNYTILKDFDTFKLYYGIHLYQNGNIINNTMISFGADKSASNNVTSKYWMTAAQVIRNNELEMPSPDAFMNTKKLCSDIIAFCSKHYKGSDKLPGEYFISAYYDGLCLAIHHLKDENAFTKDDAYSFLQSVCDTEYCDVYSDRLFAYAQGGSESDNIWELFRPYLRTILGDIRGMNEVSDEVLHAAMEPAVVIGIAVANKFYDPDRQKKCYCIGEQIDISALIGRNFYHYTNGIIDAIQPFNICPDDIPPFEYDDEDDEDNTEETHDFRKATLSAFVPRSCWIKKLNVSEDNYEANRLVIVELDNNFNITVVTEVLEEVKRMGGGLFMIPGMEMPATYEYQLEDCLSDASEEEMELLLKKRYLPMSFSFIGKKLPKAMIDEGGNGGNDTNYTFALQSAYRQAYMHLSINTTKDGIIQGFDYSTYQSTGSSYGDLFTRPQCISDKRSEIIDVLLYIIDKYTDIEFRKLDK